MIQEVQPQYSTILLIHKGTDDEFVSVNNEYVYPNPGRISNIAPFPTAINPAVQ